MTKTVTFLAGIALATVANATVVELDNGTIVEITVQDGAGVCSAADPGACEVGSTQYCTYSQDKQDRESSFTFETTAFLRACDTNADGRYTYCLDYVPHKDGSFTFEDQTYYKYCDNLDFNPIRGREVGE